MERRKFALEFKLEALRPDQGSRRIVCAGVTGGEATGRHKTRWRRRA
jgi:hypothetical protein